MCFIECGNKHAATLLFGLLRRFTVPARAGYMNEAMKNGLKGQEFQAAKRREYSRIENPEGKC